MDNSIKIDPWVLENMTQDGCIQQNINPEGIQKVGKGFGTQISKKIKNPRVVVGHDYRSYSEKVKKNL